MLMQAGLAGHSSSSTVTAIGSQSKQLVRAATISPSRMTPALRKIPAGEGRGSGGCKNIECACEHIPLMQAAFKCPSPPGGLRAASTSHLLVSASVRLRWCCTWLDRCLNSANVSNFLVAGLTHPLLADYFDPQRQNFGCLRVLNDDLVQPHAGFGAHPHRDAEIFSYIVEGSLSHQDSMQNKESLPR